MSKTEDHCDEYCLIHCQKLWASQNCRAEGALKFSGIEPSRKKQVSVELPLSQFPSNLKLYKWRVWGNTACLLLFSALILNGTWREAGMLCRHWEFICICSAQRQTKGVRAERRKCKICSNNHQKSCILNALLSV